MSRRIEFKTVTLTFSLAVLCALMLFSVSCKKREEAPTAPATSTAAPTAPAPTPAKAPEKNIPQIVAGKYNVAFVFIGPIGDGGWTYAHNLGRKYLEEKLGVPTAYIENVGEGAEAEQVIRSLARKGFSAIIGTSFGYMDAMETVAKEFPAVNFLHISGFKNNGKNFGNLFGAMENMKYLAGMIAGARAQADKVTKVGFIAPFPIPEVIRLGNALMLGVRQTCPTCTMDVRWINSWFEPTREREAAESLLQAGAQVVITGADTSGPIVAAKDAKKWAIGYDSVNACQVAPERCLTTPYWHWGPVYMEVIKSMQEGKWRGGDQYFDGDSGLLGLYGFMEGQKIPEGVPPSVVPKIKDLLAKMQAGKFTRFDVFAAPLVDNHGKTVLAKGAKLTQKDLEGLPGGTIGMQWLAQGITGELPAKK